MTLIYPALSGGIVSLWLSQDEGQKHGEGARLHVHTAPLPGTRDQYRYVPRPSQLAI